jgi:hypothetical protein
MSNASQSSTAPTKARRGDRRRHPIRSTSPRSFAQRCPMSGSPRCATHGRPRRPRRPRQSAGRSRRRRLATQGRSPTSSPSVTSTRRATRIEPAPRFGRLRSRDRVAGAWLLRGHCDASGDWAGRAKAIRAVLPSRPRPRGRRRVSAGRGLPLYAYCSHPGVTTASQG